MPSIWWWKNIYCWFVFFIILKFNKISFVYLALLIKYNLIKKLTISNENKFLAFFIVPRRAMLKQQVEKIKQIGNLRVIACDELNNPTQFTNTYDVIVCTPQKLLK